MNPNEYKKLYIFAALIFLGFVGIVGRIYFIIRDHPNHVEYEGSAPRIVKIQGKRGTIYDRNGTPLAMSEPKSNIAIDPRGVTYKKEMTAFLIANMPQLDPQVIEKALKRDSNFQYLQRDAKYEDVSRLKQAVKTKIKDVNSQIKSIRSRKEGIGGEKDSQKNQEADYFRKIRDDFASIIYENGYKRVYPQGKLLANVLGHTNKYKIVGDKQNDGIEGIEWKYDEFLSGELKEINKNPNVHIPLSEDDLSVYDGADVYLTIDADIQFIAEEELAKVMEKSKAKWGSVVIMEPSSGKILAMANNPSFDPENYGSPENSDPAKHRNFAVADLFEPGSTFKVFSILAVLNENLSKPGETVFGENGRFFFGKNLVRDSHPNQYMTIRDVIVTSSNIGTIKFADRLSNKQLYEYFTMFGFGQKSGINIAGEASRAIRKYDKWVPIDKGNLSFGQGLSVNMVQMVRAYSALYNGGVLWQPVIVDRIKGFKDGKKIDKIIAPEPKRLTFKYNSDRQVVSMMEGVVTEGTARRAQLNGVEVGGKTGTAQIYDVKAKKYSWNRVVCSFIGGVPNNNPAFVMMVAINEPQGKEYGGTIAAPVFKAISERILPKFGVFLNKKEKDKAKIPDMIDEDKTGTAIAEESGEESDLVAEGDYVRVPNFVGKDVSEAIKLAGLNSLEVVISGSQLKNKIAGQYPKVGSTVSAGTVVTLETLKEEKDENI
ncbi:PASTA domain-containing protein [bacterium]|nr:PASTA domain-containing protein [bacterium]